MWQRRRGLLALGVFALILFATVFVHFFHTEKDLRPDRTCPACRLQTTSLAVGVVLPVNLPQPLLVEVLPVLVSKVEASAVFFDLVSRPPPLV